jgi:lysine 2,3-aminomutase
MENSQYISTDRNMKTYVKKAIKEKINIWNKRLNTSVTQKEWNSWKWQVKNSLKTLKEIEKFIPLTETEKNNIKEVCEHFPMLVTPHFISNVALLYFQGRKEEADALTKCCLPSRSELNITPQGTDDGLGEEGTTPYPFISQLYRDRILLFVSHHCPFFCRYCFRRRKVILPPNQKFKNVSIAIGNNLEKVLSYIKEKKDIRDVILSGGEPLLLSDNQIEKILKLLRQISHVKIIRVDTKMPIVVPMRITKDLVKMLKKYHPIFMTLHFVHPAEITPEVEEACERLVDAGIPLGTYTPVLRGINDNRETLKELFWRLVQIRIRPYYLVQFVPTPWTEHFRVPLEKSLSLIEGIHGELSGLAIPSFKVYVPGKGKVPLLPNYYIKRTPQGHLLKTINGKEGLYEEPVK